MIPRVKGRNGKMKNTKETVPRKARSPLKDAGFLLRAFPRERQYAELGNLLPFYFRLAVKTRCIGPSSWHAVYIYPITVRTFGHAPVEYGACDFTGVAPCPNHLPCLTLDKSGKGTK